PLEDISHDRVGHRPVAERGDVGLRDEDQDDAGISRNRSPRPEVTVVQTELETLERARHADGDDDDERERGDRRAEGEARPEPGGDLRPPQRFLALRVEEEDAATGGRVPEDLIRIGERLVAYRA